MSKQKNISFLEALQHVAQEQHALTEHQLLPGWLAPFGAFLGKNAFVTIMMLSLVVSGVIFLLYFPFIFAFGKKLL